MSKETLTFEKSIKAPPSQVYHAFTNATALREWMCDGATVNPRPGGRLYVWWNAGYWASGEFTTLKPNKSLAFTWHGRGQPVGTQVGVNLEERENGALLTLTHTAEGSGLEFEKALGEFRSEWPRALENLVSVLETGQDLRFVRRPMLGISLTDFDEEKATTLGVPATQGVRIDGVLEGMGAQAAGLRNDDVIVSIDDHPVDGFASITTALQRRQAGDIVDVVFYRGPEKISAKMRLSARPLPEVPDTASGMAEALRKSYENPLAELDGSLEGVTEKEASYKPAPEEWSVKEVLAHLIHNERWTQSYVTDLISAQERVSDDYSGNIQAPVTATVAVYPTVTSLMDELKRSTEENVALIAALPEEFVVRKGSYTRLGYDILDNQGSHILNHISQINATIQAARGQ